MIERYYSLNNEPIELPLGKLICVGRNYVAHVDEMSSPMPEAPLLFMKPSTALADARNPIAIPCDFGECHHEAELALLIGDKIDRNTPLALDKQLYGIGLALDLTLRDIQAQCKQKGHPWERAKSFDDSCPITPFVKVNSQDIEAMSFSLSVNGKLRQKGLIANMIFPIVQLLEEIKAQFTLLPGDIVLTGTPSGVGALSPKDEITLILDSQFSISTQVCAWQ